jgi:WD40 repeat protein
VVVTSVADGRRLAELTGHPDRLDALTFLLDGRLASASATVVRVFPADLTGAPVLLAGHLGAVNAIAGDRRGRLLTASEDRTARLWDGAGGRLLGTLSGHPGPVTAAAIVPSGALAATAGDDRTVRIWDGETFRLLVVHRGHTGVIDQLRFGADSRTLVSAAWDGSIRVWDVGHGPLDLEAIGQLARCRHPFEIRGGQLMPLDAADPACAPIGTAK